jgi:hypothetical protein
MSKDGKKDAAPLRAFYNKVLETLGKLHNALYSQLLIHFSVVKSVIKYTMST